MKFGKCPYMHKCDKESNKIIRKENSNVDKKQLFGNLSRNIFSDYTIIEKKQENLYCVEHLNLTSYVKLFHIQRYEIFAHKYNSYININIKINISINIWY